MGAKRGQGTSALLTHLKRCKNRNSALKMLQDLSSTLRSPSGRRLKDWRYDPDVSRFELIRMISLHGVPFLFMQYDGFRRFISSLNPLFKVPCRTTVRNACIKEFEEMKIQLKDTLSKDQKYTYLPSPVEWDSVDVLCNLLKLFKKATKVISGTNYPTTNLYFHHMWKIKMELEEKLESTELELQNVEKEDNSGVVVADQATKLRFLKEMIKVLKEMKKKFDKYWNLSHITLCVPVVFDPRFKLKFVEFIFKKAFPVTAKEKIDKVEEIVRGLFSEYSHQQETPRVSSTQQETPSVGSIKNDPWTEWYQKVDDDLQSRKSTELDMYLDEVAIRAEELDVISWWAGNAAKYPTLSRIVRDLFAVPATSVPSESAFSMARRTVNDFRSTLTAETVEALVCTQDWYRSEGSADFSMAAIDDLIMEKDETSNS